MGILLREKNGGRQWPASSFRCNCDLANMMMSQDGIEAIMVVFWANEKAKNVLRRFFIRRIDAPISFFSQVRLL